MKQKDEQTINNVFFSLLSNPMISFQFTANYFQCFKFVTEGFQSKSSRLAAWALSGLTFYVLSSLFNITIYQIK